MYLFWTITSGVHSIVDEILNLNKYGVFAFDAIFFSAIIIIIYV